MKQSIITVEDYTDPNDEERYVAQVRAQIRDEQQEGFNVMMEESIFNPYSNQKL
jgi:hypothetical protein